jgi:hypothetical protein
MLAAALLGGFAFDGFAGADAAAAARTLTQKPLRQGKKKLICPSHNKFGTVSDLDGRRAASHPTLHEPFPGYAHRSSVQPGVLLRILSLYHHQYGSRGCRRARTLSVGASCPSLTNTLD